jgi:hypothetical protein
VGRRPMGTHNPSSGQRHDPSVGSIQNSRFLLVLLFRLLDCLSELLDCGDLR